MHYKQTTRISQKMKWEYAVKSKRNEMGCNRQLICIVRESKHRNGKLQCNASATFAKETRCLRIVQRKMHGEMCRKKNGSIISMVVNENFISFVTFLRTALNHFIKREKKLKYFEIVHKNVLTHTHTQAHTEAIVLLCQLCCSNWKWCVKNISFRCNSFELELQLTHYEPKLNTMFCAHTLEIRIKTLWVA